MGLETRLAELSTMNAVGEILNQEADFTVAIGRVLPRLVKLLDLSTGWVFLTRMAQGDSHQGGFRVAARVGLPPALNRDEAAPLCSGNCDCQYLLRHGKLDKGVNIVHCSRLEAASGDKRGLEFHASVPLLGRAGPVGIMNLAAPGSERFDGATLSFLTAVGRQLGTAFERSRLSEARTQEARYAATLEERQRLATEMHDSVAQLLFAADLSLRVARESPDETQRQRSLDKTAELLRSALSELGSLVEVLRPADLSGGLPAALARLAERTSGVVRVHLEAEDLPLSGAQSEAFYRVAQEALHNTLKHAGAANAWLRLGRTRDGVYLLVEDDGRGLGAVAPGLGLTSMRSRAEVLGGRLELRERKPHGVWLRLRIPWPGS